MPLKDEPARLQPCYLRLGMETQTCYPCPVFLGALVANHQGDIERETLHSAVVCANVPRRITVRRKK